MSYCVVIIIILKISLSKFVLYIEPVMQCVLFCWHYLTSVGLVVLCAGSTELPQIAFAKSPEGHLCAWGLALELEPFCYIFNIMCAIAKILVSF